MKTFPITCDEKTFFNINKYVVNVIGIPPILRIINGSIIKMIGINNDKSGDVILYILNA
jgi:hypothetical protein